MYKKPGRKSETSSLKSVIEEMLESYKIKDKFDQNKLIANWEQIMGTMIAKRTDKVYVHKKVLFVHLNSAALRNELSIAKQKVLDLIWEHTGKDQIKDVKFL